MSVDRLRAERVSLPEDDYRAGLREHIRRLTNSPSFTEAKRLAQSEPTAYPYKFMRQAAAHGLTAMEIDERYYPAGFEGQSLTPLEQSIVMEELARWDPGLALQLLVQNSLTAYEVNRFGTAEQKSALLPGMASGEIRACFALTEPDVGSDAKNIQIRAIREGDNFVIRSGAKRFITGANGADIMLLAARTGESGDRDKAITFFVVDMHTPGITVKEFSKPGQAGSPLCEVYFDNVCLPASAALGGEETINKGWAIIDATLKHSRNWIAAQGVGLAQRAYDEAVRYGAERMVHGKYLVELDDHSAGLRVIDAQVDLARRLVQTAAGMEESGEERFWVASSLSKLIACETAAWAPLEAMQLHGGIGYVEETEICKVWLSSPVLRIYEGAVPIQVKLIQSGGISKDTIRHLLPPKLGEFYVADEHELVGVAYVNQALAEFNNKI